MSDLSGPIRLDLASSDGEEGKKASNNYTAYLISYMLLCVVREIVISLLIFIVVAYLLLGGSL